MNWKLAAAASVALVAVAACRSKTEAYDTTSAGAYATPPAVVGATTSTSVGMTTGATTMVKPDTAKKDTTKKSTKAP